MIGGRLQIQQEALSVVLPHVKAGRVTAIAAGTTKRLPQLPEVPSLNELVPGFVAVTPWLGILGAAGTPASIVAKVNQDVHAILLQPDVLEKLAANGLTPTNEGPEAFTRSLVNDYDRLGKLVKQLAIKVD